MLINDKVGVPQRIAELQAEYAAKIGFAIEDMLNKYLSVMRVHPADLVTLVLNPSRNCHVTSHAYQWRTARIIRSYQGAPVRARYVKASHHEADGR